MIAKIRKNQQALIILLITICIGIILIGGFQYVRKLRSGLQDNAVQNLMTVTAQQQQSFDTFIEKDQDQVHAFAEFFSGNGICDPETIRHLLTLPDERDATYLVVCLDEGWICSTYFDDTRQVDDENLAVYRSLDGRGVRDDYTGFYSGTPRFGYYETFTFSSGHQGLIQKSYDRSRVSEKFALSFYNGQGTSYAVNRQGDILLRPAGAGEGFYENIFDLLAETHQDLEPVNRLKEELAAHRSGSMAMDSGEGAHIYTYIPVETVDGWYLISSVPEEAVTEEAHRMLLEFQVALGLMILLLLICAVFILLAWRTQKDLLEKDRAIAYQTQLFDMFTTYLAGNTNDIYLIIDCATGRLEYVSPNVKRVLGVEPEEILGVLEAQDMAADPEAAAAYYEKVDALAPGTAAAARYTERVNTVTGERLYFWENAYCALIQGTAKRVCCISDRTRERKSQNNLAEALHMAQAANDAKSTFLSNVSHDIRTPMNAIIGFLALMRDEADNPAMVMEYNRRIDAASQHLLGLINDVLDMNKIESGSTTLNISEVNHS